METGSKNTIFCQTLSHPFEENRHLHFGTDTTQRLVEAAEEVRKHRHIQFDPSDRLLNQAQEAMKNRLSLAILDLSNHEQMRLARQEQADTMGVSIEEYMLAESELAALAHRNRRRKETITVTPHS